MDLRHLRYFAAVADERNFTRAAERLGIKQPPLSLQIKQLEHELGSALFRRLTRGIELTEAGQLLLEEARPLLERVERLKTNVQSRARGTTGRIRVGFAGATYFQPRVPSLIQAYRSLYPDVTLSPLQSNTPHLVNALREGEIDVAFVRPPVAEGEGISVQPLVEEQMRIVLPAQHPQARRRAVPLAALSGEMFILFPRAIGPGLHDSIIAACQRAGFSPVLGQEAPQISSIVHLVAAGFGVSVVPQSIEQIQAEGIAYLRIEGASPPAPIGLAVNIEHRSATVRNFLALARKQSRAGQ